MKKRLRILMLSGLITIPFLTMASSAGDDEFASVLRRFGAIHTIAGRGQLDSNGGNDWDDAFEGGLAREAELSEAHNAQADVFGNIFIVDKDSHSVRVVRPDGTIHRVAGTNASGNGSDDSQPGRECALSGPNGIHVQPDGVCYIFDTFNRKIRRLDRNGRIATVFTDASMSVVGRGLWVNPEGSVIYYASGSEVRVWTPSEGSKTLASGFSGGLANLTVDPRGRVVVTDRNAHAVIRIESDGSLTRIAGNGRATGGGDGQAATETAMEEVRGIAFAPSGGFFTATHRGSDVWFVDSQGIAHLFIPGVRNSDPYAGEGEIASSVANKLSEIRAISLSPGGDLIITHSDESTVRIVENVCPPVSQPLALSLNKGELVLEQATDWDGGWIEASPLPVDDSWQPILFSGAENSVRRWTLRLPLEYPTRYFRFRSAVRWPAP